MKNQKENLLRLIKIYSIDDSKVATQTLYRVVKNLIDDFDIITMTEVVQSMPQNGYNRLLAYANKMEDLSLVTQLHTYRNSKIVKKSQPEPKKEDDEVEYIDWY